MTEKILAALTIATCAVLLLRLLLGKRRRARFDAAARRAWFATQRSALSVWHWRDRRRHAAKIAEETIRRARSAGTEREGNVYKPKSFRKPPKDKMH